eukprot:8852024-Pyramimonas_sp.AAC.1
MVPSGFSYNPSPASRARFGAHRTPDGSLRFQMLSLGPTFARQSRPVVPVARRWFHAGPEGLDRL